MSSQADVDRDMNLCRIVMLYTVALSYRRFRRLSSLKAWHGVSLLSISLIQALLSSNVSSSSDVSSS